MAEQITEPPAQNWAATCAPLLAIVVAIGTHAWLYWSFLLCPAGDKSCIPFDTGPMLKGLNKGYATDASVYVGGAMWTLASGTYLLVGAVALIASVYVIREGVGGRVKGRQGVVPIALVLLWAVLIALVPTVLYTKDVGAPGLRLLSETVGSVLPGINTYNRLFDALGLSVGLMLAVAACAAIRPDPVEDLEGRALLRRMRLLRTVLYAGAAALVVSVVRLSVMLNWGGRFLPASNEQVSTLITGIVNTLGVYYTILLAAVYVPAALVLRRRAHALADRNQQPPEQQEAWLTGRGLALSYTQYLPRLVAIFGPLLVGPASAFVKSALNVQ